MVELKVKMECPLSVYQGTHWRAAVPVFFADTNTQDTSGVTRRALLKEPIKPSTTFGGAKVFENSIYDQNQLKLNLTCSNTNIENPLLYGEIYLQLLPNLWVKHIRGQR